MFKQYLFIIGFISVFSYSQEFTIKQTPEEIQREKELKEEKNYLKFQNHFFIALQQKAKEDYHKAIEALEECSQLIPNNVAVNYEFSKNYLLLKDYDNAVFFAMEVLKEKQNNLPVYEHLKDVYKKQRDFDNAIKVQRKINTLKPNNSSDLIQLYLMNRQKEKAKDFFLELEEKRIPINYESHYRRILYLTKLKEIKPIATKTVSKVNTITELQTLFSQDKQYKTLKKLIEKELTEKNYKALVQDSKKGLELFPAQPYLYLMQGKAENNLGQNANAVEILEIGLDFIIDNTKLEKEFYIQMHKAYLGLNNPTKATIYLEKAKKLN